MATIAPTIDGEKTKCQILVHRAKFGICFFSQPLTSKVASTSSATEPQVQRQNCKLSGREDHSLATCVALRYSAGVWPVMWRNAVKK